MSSDKGFLALQQSRSGIRSLILLREAVAGNSDGVDDKTATDALPGTTLADAKLKGKGGDGEPLSGRDHGVSDLRLRDEGERRAVFCRVSLLTITAASSSLSFRRR